MGMGGTLFIYQKADATARPSFPSLVFRSQSCFIHFSLNPRHVLHKNSSTPAFSLSLCWLREERTPISIQRHSYNQCPSKQFTRILNLSCPLSWMISMISIKLEVVPNIAAYFCSTTLIVCLLTWNHPKYVYGCRIHLLYKHAI